MVCVFYSFGLIARVGSILYINSRSPSVRLSETTVPRYNPPTELSCQTDRRSEFIGRYMQQQQWRRSGKRKERMKLSLPSKAAAVEALRKKGREMKLSKRRLRDEK